MNGRSSTYPYWTLEAATAVFAGLRNSELAADLAPIEALQKECVSIDNQIAALEAQRRVAEESGKKVIAAYESAYFRLFLQKVKATGKEYCDCGDHVVSEVSIQLMWNNNCPGYYIHRTCPECLAGIKAGKSVGCGNKMVLYEMKEVDGSRLWLKDGEWRPLPEHLHDYTSEDASGYVGPDLAKEYGLDSIQFWPAEFR